MLGRNSWLLKFIFYFSMVGVAASVCFGQSVNMTSSVGPTITVYQGQAVNFSYYYNANPVYQYGTEYFNSGTIYDLYIFGPYISGITENIETGDGESLPGNGQYTYYTPGSYTQTMNSTVSTYQIEEVYTTNSSGYMQFDRDYDIDSSPTLFSAQTQVTVLDVAPTLVQYGAVVTGETAELTATATDPGLGYGDSVTYSWYLGSDLLGTGDDLDSTFAQPGDYQVNVVAADAYGESDSQTVDVNIAAVPEPASLNVMMVVPLLLGRLRRSRDTEIQIGAGTRAAINSLAESAP